MTQENEIATSQDAIITRRVLKELELPIPVSLTDAKEMVLEARHLVDSMELGMMSGPRRRITQSPLFRESLVVALATLRTCHEVGLLEWGMTYEDLANTIAGVRMLIGVATVRHRKPDDNPLAAVYLAAKVLDIEPSIPRTVSEYLRAA